MTVRVMTSGGSAEGGTGWVSLIADLAGPDSDGVEVGVRTGAGDWQTATSSRGVSGRRELVLGDIDEQLEVVVTLAQVDSRGAFRHGTTAGLRIVVRGSATDGDEFICPVVNLSGLQSSVVAVLVPTANGMRVTVPGPVAAPAESVEPEPAVVEGVPGAALNAARRVIGHRARVAPQDTRAIRVVLDRSASMLPHARSGAIADVLAVCAGLNAVVGSGEVEVSAVSTPGEAWGRVTLPAGGNAADEVSTELFSQVSTGFVTSFLPMAMVGPGSGPAAVYVVTDAVPADIADFVEALATPSVAGADVLWHLIVLAGDEPTARAVPAGGASAPRALADGRSESARLAATTVVTPLRPDAGATVENRRLTELVEWALGWVPVPM